MLAALSAVLAVASCKAAPEKTPFLTAGEQHILPGVRTMELGCELAISGIPERAKQLRAWVPFPVAGRYQRVIEPTVESPSSYRPVIHYDAQYDTPMMYLSADGPPLPSELKLVYSVRVERGMVEPNELKAGPMEPDNVLQRLFATDLALGSGPSRDELVKIAEGIAPPDNSPMARARRIYDYVLNTVEIDNSATFSPPTPAADNATAAPAPATEGPMTTPGAPADNATLSRAAQYALNVLTFHKAAPVDYATATAMLMRAAGIPAHVESGLLLGEDKTPDRAAASESAAWVRFYVNGMGWSACDPYLAKRYPELRERMFAGLSANRVQMSAGPEPALVPAPQSGLPILFFAPIVEADGKPVFASMRLTFRDVPGGK